MAEQAPPADATAPSSSPPPPSDPARDQRIRRLHTHTATLQSQLLDLTTHRTALLSALHTALHPSSAHPSSPPISPLPPPPPALSLHPSSAAHTIPILTPPDSSLAPLASLADAEAILKRHIRLLHTYNEIRDVGMGLMGLIAEQRGVRVRDVQGEFGIEGRD